MGLKRRGPVGHEGGVPATDEVGAGVPDGVAHDELRSRMREGVVPHAVAGEVVAGGGEAREEGRGGVAVPADGLVICVVADVERVLSIARDGRRPGAAQYAAVKA